MVVKNNTMVGSHFVYMIYQELSSFYLSASLQHITCIYTCKMHFMVLVMANRQQSRIRLNRSRLHFQLTIQVTHI